MKRFLAVLPFERRRPVHHLIREDPQGPPVDGELVSLAADYLRRDVLLRADERVGPFAVGETRPPSTHRADTGGLGFLQPAPDNIRRMERDPPGKTPAIFPARCWRLGIRQWCRSSNGIGNGFFWREVAREVEVGEGDVAGMLNEDVLWLEVAVGDAHGMEVVEGAEDFSEVEANDGRGENAVVLTVP